jgi:hypothetical protein
MSRFPDIASGFKALREIDLNAIRNQAEGPFHLSIIGGDWVGKSTLITQLLTGPGAFNSNSLSEISLNQAPNIPFGGVVILMVDASQAEHLQEHQVFERLRVNQIPIIVVYNKTDLTPGTKSQFHETLNWPGSEVAAISAVDRNTILQQLGPALLRVFKGREVLLARHLPLMREAVSRKLIEDTSFANAAYSLATGLAEINILVDLALNMADMVMLTKNQALMAYKISLAFGLPADWRQTIPKLAAVVGSAFIWRLLARQLVGLIPAFSIIPKVAISFAGTYAVGQAVYQWCAHNEQVKPETLRSYYQLALKQGKELARSLMEKRRFPAGNLIPEATTL